MIPYPAPTLGARIYRAKVRPHPSAGFWRALPLALTLSAGWWAIGLGAVTALSHWH